MGGGNTNPGKRFEARFSKSLKALPGSSMRIYDGGAYTKLRMPGDFVYWADNGSDYLFECKSTKETSFPFAKIKSHQIKSLMEFTSDRRHGIVALNFYGENYRDKNDLYLIDVHKFVEYATKCGRKSLPEFVAQEIGVKCSHVKGGMWDLCLEEFGEQDLR